MLRREWIRLLSLEENGDHLRVLLPSKPPIAGWSPGILEEIAETVPRNGGRLLVDLSSMRYVNREIFTFFVLLIARAGKEGWRLVFAGPNRVVGPHPLMNDLREHCVIVPTLEDGTGFLEGEEPVLWSPGEEAYDAPVDWNALASLAGCVVVPLMAVALVVWLLTR